MSDFDFIGTVDCPRCGATKSSSEEECTECSPEDLRNIVFDNILDDRTVVVEALTVKRAWELLAETVDDPLPWRCRDTGDLSLNAKQAGVDVLSIAEGNA